MIFTVRQTYIKFIETSGEKTFHINIWNGQKLLQCEYAWGKPPSRRLNFVAGQRVKSSVRLLRLHVPYSHARQESSHTILRDLRRQTSKQSRFCSAFYHAE